MRSQNKTNVATWSLQNKRINQEHSIDHTSAAVNKYGAKISSYAENPLIQGCIRQF